MTASAVDSEQLAAMVRRSLKVEGGLEVGILSGVAQNPKQQNHACCCGKHHQGTDQTRATVALGVNVLICSS